jgi:hypothetical protein
MGEHWRSKAARTCKEAVALRTEAKNFWKKTKSPGDKTPWRRLATAARRFAFKNSDEAQAIYTAASDARDFVWSLENSE